MCPESAYLAVRVRENRIPHCQFLAILTADRLNRHAPDRSEFRYEVRPVMWEDELVSPCQWRVFKRPLMEA